MVLGILEGDTAIIHITRTVPIFDAKDSHLAADSVIFSLTNATNCTSAHQQHSIINSILVISFIS